MTEVGLHIELIIYGSSSLGFKTLGHIILYVTDHDVSTETETENDVDWHRKRVTNL